MITINIDPTKIEGTVSPMIYGQMIEQAYWSVHLGLCAQMIDNGGFELDRDGVHDTVAQGWTLMSTEGRNRYAARLDDENPYNANHCQKIDVKDYIGGEIRLMQGGLHVKTGVDYNGFLFLRGKVDGDVSISLLSTTKRVAAGQSLGRIHQEEWRKHEIRLHPEEDSEDAAFALRIRGSGRLWIDQIQLYPSDTYLGHGTRPDMVALYKELHPAFLRWPGGTYLIWHHWKNAIGPLEGRCCGHGRRLGHGDNPTHAGEWDPSTFGTDEYVQLCRDVGAEPMINVNIKDGLQNTLDWIEYCNGGTDTAWGAERERNGHSEPYGVKYWVVDNEPLVLTEDKGYARSTYPKLARKWAEAMKRKNPGIMVMIMGDHDMRSSVDRLPEFSVRVVEETRGAIDRLCVHCYYDQSVYAPLQGMPYKLGEGIARLKNMFDHRCRGRDVKVFLSEWNPQSSAREGGNMGQAIEAAQTFHMLERKSAEGSLDMATPCQLCVNVDRYRGFWLRSAPVQINNHTAWTSPMYHVNALYASLREPYLLEVSSADIPTIGSQAFEGYRFPALDVVAARGEENGTVVIKAVNGSDQDLVVKFDIQSMGTVESVRVTVIAAESILTVNTAFSPEEVAPEESELKPDEKGFVYVFRPFSVTAFEVAGA